MSVEHLKAVMDGLCRYYTDRDGNPRKLNPTQTAVYTSLLGQFPHEELQAAATRWMAKSAFFPAASDLRKLLITEADETTQAHLAWATVERAIRHAGIYRGATFENGAIGETARQVLGTWQQACTFDLDSPGWAIRRQAFLALYPTIAARALGPVTLAGLHRLQPLVIDLVPGLPGRPDAAALTEEPLTHEESRKAIKGLVDRGILAWPIGPKRTE